MSNLNVFRLPEKENKIDDLGLDKDDLEGFHGYDLILNQHTLSGCDIFNIVNDGVAYPLLINNNNPFSKTPSERDISVMIAAIKNTIKYIEQNIGGSAKIKEMERSFHFDEIEKFKHITPNKITNIYVMFCDLKNEYKIGESTCVESRKIDLERERGNKLTLLFKSPKCLAKNETDLHVIFRKKHVRGEWFLLNDSDIEYIRGYEFEY